MVALTARGQGEVIHQALQQQQRYFALSSALVSQSNIKSAYADIHNHSDYRGCNSQMDSLKQTTSDAYTATRTLFVISNEVCEPGKHVSLDQPSPTLGA